MGHCHIIIFIFTSMFSKDNFACVKLSGEYYSIKICNTISINYTKSFHL